MTTPLSPVEPADARPSDIEPTPLVAGSAATVAKSKKRRRRGWGCVGAAAFTLVLLALLGVVVVGSVAVLGVAGAGGALYYLTSESSSEDNAVAMGVTDGEELTRMSNGANVVAPATPGLAGTEADLAPTHKEADVADDPTPSRDKPSGPDVSGGRATVRDGGSGSTTDRPDDGSLGADAAKKKGGHDKDVAKKKGGHDKVVKVGQGGVSLDADVAARALGSKLQRSSSRVSVVGEDVSVTFLKGSKRLSVPGRVDAGRYQIEATFNGEPPVIVGTVKVRAGTPVSVSCNARMGMCRVQ